MKRFIAGVAVGFLVSAISIATAQEVPLIQHSFFTPAVTTVQGTADEWHVEPFNGIGYSSTWTIKDKGDVNVVGLSGIHVITFASDPNQFIYRAGFAFDVTNFQVGVGWDAVNLEQQRGFLLGNGQIQPDAIYFNFKLPLNGGGLVGLFR